MPAGQFALGDAAFALPVTTSEPHDEKREQWWIDRESGKPKPSIKAQPAPQPWNACQGEMC
jgi:hypothetical protein